jgi:hypothetical protein
MERYAGNCAMQRLTGECEHGCSGRDDTFAASSQLQSLQEHSI